MRIKTLFVIIVFLTVFAFNGHVKSFACLESIDDNISIGKYLSGHMWTIHLSSIERGAPFSWYKAFRFDKNGQIYSKNDNLIGAWWVSYGGFTMTVGRDGLIGSFSFLNDSTIMTGSGEINDEPWQVKLILVRGHRL